MHNFEQIRERMLLANADYEDQRSKCTSTSWSIRNVERDWKLKAGSLSNFRANRNRRLYSGVTITSKFK